MNEMDENEISKKRVLLWDYLTYNFKPPLEKVLKKDWVKWFTMYWRDEITRNELITVCPMRLVELIVKFDVFFKSEDLE